MRWADYHRLSKSMAACMNFCKAYILIRIFHWKTMPHLLCSESNYGWQQTKLIGGCCRFSFDYSVKSYLDYAAGPARLSMSGAHEKQGSEIVLKCLQNAPVPSIHAACCQGYAHAYYINESPLSSACEGLRANRVTYPTTAPICTFENAIKPLSRNISALLEIVRQFRS